MFCACVDGQVFVFHCPGVIQSVKRGVPQQIPERPGSGHFVPLPFLNMVPSKAVRTYPHIDQRRAPGRRQAPVTQIRRKTFPRLRETNALRFPKPEASAGSTHTGGLYEQHVYVERPLAWRLGLATSLLMGFYGGPGPVLLTA